MKRQAELLKLSRSDLNFAPRPLPERDRTLIRRLDE